MKDGYMPYEVRDKQERKKLKEMEDFARNILSIDTDKRELDYSRENQFL